MNDTSVALIARRVSQRRRDLGWNLSDLARRSGIGTSYISRLEKAVYGRPSAEMLTRIANALGCRVSDLTEPEPVPTEPAYEAGLRELYGDDAALMAEIIRVTARHDDKRRRYLLETFRDQAAKLPER